ncbi:MAG: crossover junction endodeoxyribonuclease RuvC [Chthoniobacteraceae bacterium]
MRLLAIDPSLRCTGFAVLERLEARKVRALEYGTIPNSPKIPASSCLVAIHDRISGLITQYQPECAAIEAVIYVQSYRTAITLGAARGSSILALAQRGVPVFEYSPKDAKQAVVGRGGADKSQVAFMVRAMLGLTETPSPDAADALAIGLTHLQSYDSAQLGVKVLKRI